MGRAALGGIAFAVLAFAGGWTLAGWHRDSLDLAISKTALATGKQLSVIAGASGRQLEAKLEAIKDAQPREIRTEVVKPVFTHVCLSDEFVSLYNDAAAGTERALSGKSKD
ncbi:Phage protein [Sodalis praecaptivus]|uniref:Phage protein n=1 Tax=Sodalis praecaptivus TaxID=1239307 RepID=W0HUP3_9GAMM|nr:hypothetical protein [Sodalis praecaptivus]AHF77571.1 Phage protein [Sodalis praecaptivus]